MDTKIYSDFVGEEAAEKNKFAAADGSTTGATTKTKLGTFFQNVSTKAKTAGQTAIQNNGGVSGILGKLFGGAGSGTTTQTGMYSTGANSGTASQGMSTGAKIGIGVGILVVVVVVIYLVRKK